MQIPFWEQAEDKAFSFARDLPKLTDIAIGDWGDYGAFEGGHTISDVKVRRVHLVRLSAKLSFRICPLDSFSCIRISTWRRSFSKGLSEH